MIKTVTYLRDTSGNLVAVLGQPEITTQAEGDKVVFTFRRPVLWQRDLVKLTAEVKDALD